MKTARRPRERREMGLHADAEVTRLRRLLYTFLLRDLRMCADRDPQWLRTIRRAKRALPERYRKALPRMN